MQMKTLFLMIRLLWLIKKYKTKRKIDLMLNKNLNWENEKEKMKDPNVKTCHGYMKA